MRFLGLVFALLATGCATSPPPTKFVQAKYDATKEARLRLFGMNGAGVVYYPQTECIPDQGGVRVSGSLGQAFKSFTGGVSSVSIGMPPSRNSGNPQSGVVSQGYFVERVVAANEPMVVRVGFSSGPAAPGVRTWSCAVGGTFSPEAGRDYELVGSVEGNFCRIALNELHAPSEPGLLATETSVKMARSPECPPTERPTGSPWLGNNR